MIKVIFLLWFVFSKGLCKQTRSAQKPDVVIKENIKSGSLVALKSQYWPSTNNETWFHSIKNEEEIKDLFAIDVYSGNIKTKRKINFTNDCADKCYCVINILVVLTKKQNSEIIAKQVRVKIDDVNNNSPKFESLLNPVVILEDSTVGSLFNINQYIATDADCNKNAIIDYELEKNEFFEIYDPYNGNEEILLAKRQNLELKIKKKLDHEYHRMIRLKLTAMDKGNPPMTSSTDLTIHIGDVNDCRPVFDVGDSLISVPENSPIGSLVTTVVARDGDGSHGNNRVSYKIVGQTDAPPNQGESSYPDLLAVARESGDVTIKRKLNWKLHNGITFVIEASDNGKIPQTATTKLTLNIEDVNDHKPDLEVEYLVPTDNFDKKTGYVSEDSKQGDVIAYISTTDEDNAQNSITNINVFDESTNKKSSYFEYMKVQKCLF